MRYESNKEIDSGALEWSYDDVLQKNRIYKTTDWEDLLSDIRKTGLGLYRFESEYEKATDV